MSIQEMDALNIDDRNHARELKQQGWLPTKARLPVCRAFGPWLPPEDSDTDAARWMMRRWCLRQGAPGSQSYAGLQGYCDQPAQERFSPLFPPPDRQPDADIAFLMHSAQGHEHGDAGQFSMAGLSRIYAQLYVKTYCFIHFYSGFRRKGDLQHQVESHQIQGLVQYFCVSVDFCLQGEKSNLATNASREFWARQIKSGAVIGVGGGPLCESYTAARLLDGGPPPVRSHDEPLGLPCNTMKQWQQTMLGTVWSSSLIWPFGALVVVDALSSNIQHISCLGEEISTFQHLDFSRHAVDA